MEGRLYFIENMEKLYEKVQRDYKKLDMQDGYTYGLYHLRSRIFKILQNYLINFFFMLKDLLLLKLRTKLLEFYINRNLFKDVFNFSKLHIQYFVDQFNKVIEISELFRDSKSLDMLLNLYSASAYSVFKDEAYLKFIDKNWLLKAKRDFIDYYNRVRLQLDGAILFNNYMKFYGTWPNPNAVYYKHGLLEGDITPGGIFIDVGAFIGDSAIAMAPFYEKVISLEPNWIHLEYLLKNLHINNVHNILVLPFGISDKEEIIPVSFTSEISGEYRIRKEDRYDYMIKVIELDKLLDNLEMNNVDRLTIKIDIEGEERKALRGMKNTLKSHTTECVISAYHLPDDIVTLTKILENYGVNEIVLRDHQPWNLGEKVIIAKTY